MTPPIAEATVLIKPDMSELREELDELEPRVERIHALVKEIVADLRSLSEDRP